MASIGSRVLLVWILVSTELRTCFVSGQCLQNGRPYGNNSVWQPDPCSVCHCRYPVAVCESISCQDPVCMADRSQGLELPPDECCPICPFLGASCDVSGTTVQHDTVWSTSPCTSCHCYDGEVTCDDVTCPPIPCRPGEVKQDVDGECCPQCVPTGRPCTDEIGERKPDGSEWFPLDCVKCFCRDGQARCLPMQCPAQQCGQGESLIVKPGECCPVCVKQTCQQDGDIYTEGEQWSPDECTFCACHSGHVICRAVTCDVSLECTQGETSVRKFGQCCPQCVSTEGICTQDGIARYHGDLWQEKLCQFCACQQGNVVCTPAICAKLSCKPDELELQGLEDCCPRCVKAIGCRVQGQTFQDNETWDPDPCTVCKCIQGEVTCYHQSCPSCPVDTARDHRQSGQCCGPCLPVQCGPDCSSCLPSQPSHCTKCRDKRRFLQNGSCVTRCQDGTFPSGDNSCHACHAQCSTCYGQSKTSCLTCPSPYLLRDGQCVRQCGHDYFREGNECYDCHVTCKTCTGPRLGQCVTCRNPGHVIERGRCVDECSRDFYRRGRACVECPPGCARCGPDTGQCTACHSDRVLQNGQCVRDCNPGWVSIGRSGFCQACHPSCLECDGLRAENCTACRHGVLSPGGLCGGDDRCPTGQYLSPDGTCVACSAGCSRCDLDPSNPRSSVCWECEERGQIPFGPDCSSEGCPPGTYLRDNLCYSCEDSCALCDRPRGCLQCFPPFLLSGRDCVSDCGPGTFKAGQVCKACSPRCLHCVDKRKCLACDSSSLLQDQACVKTCAPGYITRLDERMCHSNKAAPELTINSPLMVPYGENVDVTDHVIAVSDLDTPLKYVFVVLEAIKGKGQLLRVDNLGSVLVSQGDSLSIADLKEGKLRFQHRGVSDGPCYLSLYANDGQLSSDTQELTIIIDKMTSLELVVNKPLQVNQGKTTQLNLGVLNFNTSARPDDVIITVLNGPTSGRFHIRDSDERTDRFSLSDIASGDIVYRHHGNDASTDLARLLVTDGFQKITTLFRIQVLSETSQTPVMVTNIEAHVKAGQLLKITPDLLEATIPRQEVKRNQDIIYSLVPRQANPTHGEILMMVPTPAEGQGQGWTDQGNGMMSARLYRFTQRDIDKGRIFYKSSPTLVDAVSDEVTFEVADSSMPLQALRDQVFSIRVLQDAEVAPQSLPTLAPGVRLGMAVFENQVVPISSTHLAYSDQDTDPADIVYRITSLLNDNEGSVEHEDFPYRPVLQFTQQDVDLGKILYRPPLEEIGTEEMVVSFNFVVSDGGQERQLAENKFIIRVIPVDNNPPVFLKPNPTVELAEGGVFPLTSAFLEVNDPDTDLGDLQVTVTEAPKLGIVQQARDGMTLQVRTDDTFSYEDVVSSGLQYTHSGGIHQLSDRFTISVSDGTHTTSNTITFNIVRVDRSAPRVLPTASCSINVTEGNSITLDRSIMAYSDDEYDDEDIFITPMTPITHGSVDVLVDPRRSTSQRRSQRIKVGDSFSQQDINDGRVSFIADREIGSRAVTELVYVNVSDAAGNVLPSQIVAVNIMPVDNLPPSVVLGPALQVVEGGEAELSMDIMTVMDVDTPLNRLIFTMDTQPTFGFLENRKSGKRSDVVVREKVDTSFPLVELVSGHIYYVQSDHMDKEPAWDAFLFSISDGTNESNMQRLNVSITLVNDEAPHIATEQIYAQEGGAVSLTNMSLYVTDLDTPPEDLIFTLTTPPFNGHLAKKEFSQDSLEESVVVKGKGTFTYQDILNELILYIHDDSETTEDSMTLRISDGDFSDTKTVKVVVGLVGDETPRVTINRGLRVLKGSTTVISNHELRATDLDSEDSEIEYTVKKDPPSGQLYFDNGQLSYPLSASGGDRTFKQKDIDAGYIRYIHNKDEPSGMIIFKFNLADPEGNELIDQDFFITVVDDRLPPMLVNKENLLVTEGQSALLTTKQLAFTDSDSEPGSLTYTVTDGPELGHLELLGQTGIAIKSFSQSQLAASIVQYIHTSPKELYSDRFTFVVSDGSNEIKQSFHITVRPVDDSIPVVNNNGLRVQEGVRKLVSEFDLKAVDQDTKENEIKFTVVEPPSYGSLDLLIPDVGYIPTLTFTMEDIYENRLSYKHDGSETASDFFLFLVSDGTNNKFSIQNDQPVLGAVKTPQDFPITIVPMDDGMPVLNTNLGLQFLMQHDGEARNIISSRELSASDEDTPSSEIKYKIVEPPQFGVLVHTAHPQKSISSFTQGDLDSSLVCYKLTGTTPDMQDSFVFDLMDSRPNVLPDNVFHVKWSEIGLGSPTFNVTESQGAIQVPVIRTGNLNQYAVVTCTVSPGSARSRTDGSRPGQHDFVTNSVQIQFDEWQKSQSCPIIINDDTVFEGPEVFYVELTSPTFALPGDVTKAAITIIDTEDEPMLQFRNEVIHIEETNDYVIVMVERSGDVSQTVSVVCSTESMTATGSSLSGVESGSDYISRGTSNDYRVVFPPGLAHAPCEVKIIDDSLLEPMEQFELVLSSPSHPASLGPIKTSVVIIDGPNDESTLRLGNSSLAFPEDSAEISVPVLRQGPDLSQTSSVWCHTRLSSPISAEPGQDYSPTSLKVTFGPGQVLQMCRIEILDDHLLPRLEGNETLEVFLSAATGSRIDQPASASIIIYDQHLDLPTFGFSSETYIIEEVNGTLNATVRRQGDTTQEASVICYTRQHTAHVTADFQERPLSNLSRVTFAPGEESKPCLVDIVNDEIFEPKESFNLKLTSPLGPAGIGAKLGEPASAVVTITNKDDEPKVQLGSASYSVHEPTNRQQVASVKVKVVRTGDLVRPIKVRCSTRDGSAHSGSDYNPRSGILAFEPGQRSQEFVVDVLHNSAVEWHEDFRVQLGPEDPTNATFGSITEATVTILDTEISGSIVLPAVPIVVSLLHVDDAVQGSKINPSPGYPVVCITPCDIQYPEYPTTSALCRESGINQSAILYQWEVAMPASQDGVTPMFVKITDKTLFTAINQKVLDSIYFRPFFQIRCVAQPLQETGYPGVPLRSSPVTVGHRNPICKAVTPTGTGSSKISYQAQSFLASLEYVKPAQSDTEHANMVHVSVQIPHQDGMLPLVSTLPLHNLRLLLSEPIYRQQHVCSNIITAQERAPLMLDYGFLEDSLVPGPSGSSSTNHSSAARQGEGKQQAPSAETKQYPFGPGFDFPHQFDRALRGDNALLLYQHLNLKTCTWEFNAWYHMAELLDLCGGQVVSDFQVRHGAETHLTIRVPLHVSYLFATAPVGWGSLEHRTEMEVSFYYSSVLWQSGLETESRQGGRLQVVRILIAQDGRLVLEFRTHAKFRGQFLMQHPTLPGVTSKVISSLTSTMTFDLELVWSQATFDSPHQVWRATSNYNVKDYTGVYTVELVPCLVSATQPFNPIDDPLACTARQPERFEVPISFQQSNRPVPLSYSLNTKFQITNNARMFLMDPQTQGVAEQDWEFSGSFSRGQKLYGRVLWNPDQDLSSAYRLTLEKVYLCTGRDGYVPTYDPDGEVYHEGASFGCIQPSKKLLHRFLILDRRNPTWVISDFDKIPFNAKLATHASALSGLLYMSGVDGFVMDIDPLYKVDSGHQWHLQVVYTIGPADAPLSRARRSTLISPFPPHIKAGGISPRAFVLSAEKELHTRKRRARASPPHGMEEKGVVLDLDSSLSNKGISSSGNQQNGPKYSVGKVRNGTNLIALRLEVDTILEEPDEGGNSPFIVIICVIIISITLLILLVCMVIGFAIRKRRRKRKKEIANVQGKYPTKINNLRNNITKDTKDCVAKSHKKSRNWSATNKCNIIKAKETNVLLKQGIDVDGGTEV